MPSLFKSLEESANCGELILKDGGLLQWHRHKKHPERATIYILLVLPSHRGRGLGQEMLQELRSLPGIEELQAWVEDGAPANQWYEKQGFSRVASKRSRSGEKVLHLWVWREQGDPPPISPLRQRRLALGLTLEDVSRRTGINISTLSLLERAQLPTSDQQSRLSEVLGDDI